MFNVKFGYNFWLKYLIEKHLIFSNVTTSASLLGTRSKSQDAIRNHRKTVRFVSDKQEYQPILDSTNIGGGYRLTHLERYSVNQLLFRSNLNMYSYVHMKPLLRMFMKGNEVILTGQNPLL